MEGGGGREGGDSSLSSSGSRALCLISILRDESKRRCRAISSNHTPADPLERARIEKAGGAVVFNGCYRVQHEDVRVLARRCSRPGNSNELFFSSPFLARVRESMVYSFRSLERRLPFGD